MSFVFPNIDVASLIRGETGVSYRAAVVAASGDTQWTTLVGMGYVSPTLTLSGLAAGTSIIDGVSLAVNDRFLIKDPIVATVFNATFNGTTTMVVNSVTSGLLAVGQTITGGTIPGSTTITAFGTGTGGTGNYTISGVVSAQTISVTAALTVPTSFYGIWQVVTTGSTTLTATRSADFAETDNAQTINTLVLSSGTTQANSNWLQTNVTTVSSGVNAQVWKQVAPGTGTLVAALPIGSGGTGSTSFTDNQIVKYVAASNSLVSTTTPYVTALLGNTPGNDVIVNLTDNASAVNQITIANATTGNAPIISATGTDTNIGINLQTKGTGTVIVDSTATAPGTISFQQTASTNAVSIAASASTVTPYTITLPTAVATVNNQVLASTTGGVTSWISVGSSRTYQVFSSQVQATTVAATTISYFPYQLSYFGASKASTAYFWIDNSVSGGTGRTLTVVIATLALPSTYTTLATLTVAAGTAIGPQSLAFTSPSANALIVIRINKASAGGNSASIYGAEFDIAL